MILRKLRPQWKLVAVIWAAFAVISITTPNTEKKIILRRLKGIVFSSSIEPDVNEQDKLDILEKKATAVSSKYSFPLGRDFQLKGTLPPFNVKKNKLILFWTPWYLGNKWQDRFGNPKLLQYEGCPEYRCDFTNQKSRLSEVDAVLFKSDSFLITDLPRIRHPNQRWVWVEVEAPISLRGTNAMGSLEDIGSHQINWTMTYHSDSEIIAMNGYFVTIKYKQQPVRPNLMEYHAPTMSLYMNALNNKKTLYEVMGKEWREFVSRPKLVAWMSSHCPTSSRREDYVHELNKYVPVDMYGRCGKESCFVRGILREAECWTKVMRRLYLFYMTMENSLCDEYITEKLYHPLKYGLVPVVYGSANYSKFLPPNSFINARDYHPRELAQLLTDLQRNPVEYGRYHLWRGYWKIVVYGSFCELCYRLHNDPYTGHHKDIPQWRSEIEKCKDAPLNMFHSPAWKQIIHDRNANETHIKKEQTELSLGELKNSKILILYIFIIAFLAAIGTILLMRTLCPLLLTKLK
ncbi:hypothetical protein SK128_023869 [Halocaridina rubra]|uniref:Fucosyltransferase n=1 Tax=Halocaridina rubra TaxID=373956 RepID=A0AAN8WPM2_HALRR